MRVNLLENSRSGFAGLLLFFLPRTFWPAVPRSQCRRKSGAPCKRQLSWHAARQGRARGGVGQDVTQKRKVAVHIGSGRGWQGAREIMPQPCDVFRNPPIFCKAQLRAIAVALKLIRDASGASPSSETLESPALTRARKVWPFLAPHAALPARSNAASAQT